MGGTLTLNGLSIENGFIYVGDDISVELQGTNTIARTELSVPGAEDEPTARAVVTVAALDVNGDLTVSGDGSLTATLGTEQTAATVAGTSYNGITVGGQAITVNSGTVNGTANVANGFGVNGAAITVNGGELKGTTSADGSDGVFATVGITVNNGTLSGIGGQCGIDCFGSPLTVNGGTVTGTGSDIGVNATTIEVNGGAVTGTADDSGIGILSYSLTVNDGTVIGKDSGMCGIFCGGGGDDDQVPGTLTVGGGTVTGTGGAAGIGSTGTITVTGGTMTGEATQETEEGPVQGIACNNGELSITGAFEYKTDKNGKYISVTDASTMTDPTLEAIFDNAYLSIKHTGSSSGGDTPDDNPGGSTDSGSYTPPSNTTTETTKNPDGSTTTKTENKTTGTVTETTKNPDGSQVKVETKKDGTVTTTETDTKGNKTATVANPDGSSEIKVNNKDGSTSTTTVDTEGQVKAEVKLTTAAVEATDNAPVALPMAELPASTDVEAAPTVTVSLPRSSGSVKVEIPVEDVTPGSVAILVKEDGTEEIIKTSTTSENGVVVALSSGDTVKIVDNSKTFADVPADNWAADAVSFSSARELFGGTSETTFSPDAPMTQAMMVTLLARFDGEDTSSGSTWYEQGVEWAASKGISDVTAPESNISREELALMFWRYAGSPTPTGDLSKFQDGDAVSADARQAMRWAVEKGIINGYGNGHLGPKDQTTRAQVAQMFKNFISAQ